MIAPILFIGYSVEGKCESYDLSKAEHSFDGDFAACFFTDPYSGACPHGYTKIKGDFCEAIRGRNKEKQRACCIIQPNFKVKVMHVSTMHFKDISYYDCMIM